MTLILELPDTKEAALRARAEALGLSTEEYAALILDRDLQDDALPPTPSSRHISEIVVDIMSDVPRKTFQTLPVDGAREHDHYLYGSPKKHG